MRSMLALVTIVVLPGLMFAGDGENPFKAAKVGDWVEYKMTGPNMSGKTKMTIVAKNDKEVTYEVAGTFSALGKEMTAPLQRQKIDLTKPYDAISAANLKAKGVTIETVGKGTETLKIGGKDYETTWAKTKATAPAGAATIVSEHKMWFSRGVPLSGLVKMETTTSGIATVLELVGTGNAK